MSTKFQTLCRKPRSIRLSSSEDMSDYVTEFKSSLEILNLNNSIESYDSKLRYPSFRDTLYTPIQAVFLTNDDSYEKNKQIKTNMKSARNSMPVVGFQRASFSRILCHLIASRHW